MKRNIKHLSGLIALLLVAGCPDPEQQNLPPWVILARNVAEVVRVTGNATPAAEGSDFAYRITTKKR